MPRQETRSLFGEPDEEPHATPAPTHPWPSGCVPHHRGVRRPGALVGQGRLVRKLVEGGGPLPSLILWGGPGTGKTTLAGLLAAAAGPGSCRCRRCSPASRNCARPSPRPGGPPPGQAHDPVHRRDPPVQQGAARRPAAGGRGRDRHADRGDDREPVVRGQRRLLSRCAGPDPEPARPRTTSRRSSAGAGRRRARAGRVEAGVRPRRISAAGRRRGRGDARVALTALESAVQATEPDAEGTRRVERRDPGRGDRPRPVRLRQGGRGAL